MGEGVQEWRVCGAGRRRHKMEARARQREGRGREKGEWKGEAIDLSCSLGASRMPRIRRARSTAAHIPHYSPSPLSPCFIGAW